jgi:hypothetical protein
MEQFFNDETLFYLYQLIFRTVSLEDSSLDIDQSL